MPSELDDAIANLRHQLDAITDDNRPSAYKAAFELIFNAFSAIQARISQYESREHGRLERMLEEVKRRQAHLHTDA